MDENVRNILIIGAGIGVFGGQALDVQFLILIGLFCSIIFLLLWLNEHRITWVFNRELKILDAKMENNELTEEEYYSQLKGMSADAGIVAYVPGDPEYEAVFEQ